MPVFIRKIPNRNLYRVIDANGKVFSKKTTYAKAKKQKRLLNYINAKKNKK